MAYITDRNVYFREGSKLPVQLTFSGEDNRILFFSENGEKIFFFRGFRDHSLYSINIDGSQEQALVTNDVLRTFGADYDETATPCDPILVPHTQFLLFYTCSHLDELTTVQEDDLFIIDTDTYQVRLLFPRGKGGITYGMVSGGADYVSPDGNMLAMDRPGYIDIVGIDGKMIRHKLATYTLSEPYPLDPLVYWLSDSNGLILALPVNVVYDSSPPPLYEVWRYSLATGAGVPIRLDPPIMGHESTWVSPDGNWITYSNSEEGSFLGSLRDGHTQKIDGLTGPWSPNSVHFVYEVSKPGGPDLYIASVNDLPILIEDSGFRCWLDADRYIYFKSAPHEAPAYVMGEIGKEPVTILAGNVETMWSYGNVVFHYQPSSE